MRVSGITSALKNWPGRDVVSGTSWSGKGAGIGLAAIPVEKAFVPAVPHRFLVGQPERIADAPSAGQAAAKVRERRAREQAMSPGQRLRFLQEHSERLMKGHHEWTKAQVAEHETEPNSGLGKAISYLPNCSPSRFSSVYVVAFLKLIPVRRRDSGWPTAMNVAVRGLAPPTTISTIPGAAW